MAGSPIPRALSIAAKTLATASLGAAAAEIINGIAKGNLNPVINNSYTRNTVTQFPQDLPNVGGETFCMLLTFYQYQRPSILTQPTLNMIGAICLPIPAQLVDTSTQVYDESTSSLAVGAALENIQNLGSVSGAVTAATNILAGIGQGGLNNTSASLGGANILNKGLAFGGVTQNPFLSLLYSSPTFKRHQFSWVFIPEYSQDSENLNYILNKLRYHAAPNVSPTGGGNLLTYPDLVIPTLIPQGYQYDFKPCMIEGITIDFSPGDTPSYTTKNSPSAISLTINLIESEFWIKNDYINASVDFGTNLTSTQYGKAPYASNK